MKRNSTAIVVVLAIMAVVSLAVSALGPGMAFISFLVYIIAAIVMIFPNIYLFNCAREINQFCLLNDPESLETAFEMQKKYWKYLGILAIIYLLFILIAILIGIIAAL